MDWSHVFVAAGSGLISGVMLLAAIRTKVQALEKQLDELVSERSQEAKENHRDNQNLRSAIYDVSKDMLEIQHKFVTHRQFELAMETIRREQSEVKSDVKKLIEMVAKLSVGN